MISEQARRFNDASLEVAIALGRATSLLAALASVVLAMVPLLWPVVVCSVYAAGVGWVAWWYFGNSTWTGKPLRVCGRHSPGGNLVCNVQITEANMTHVGLHRDTARDQEGAFQWR